MKPTDKILKTQISVTFKKPLKKKIMKDIFKDDEIENMIICGVSGEKIKNPRYTYISNQHTRNSKYVSEKYLNTLNKCESCELLFSENLMENHCINCINEAPKNYIRGYTDKAERYHKEIISKRDEKFKIQNEIAREQFGESDINSFVVTSGGVYVTLFGVELEYETKNHGLGVLAVRKPIEKFAIIKRDGTLQQGFEIVSAPMDKKSHYASWGALFDKIEKDENIFCTVYAPPAPGEERGTGCGCHIHISRDSMINHNTYQVKDKVLNSGPGLAVAKLLAFIHHKNNRKFVELIAGRKSNMFSNFTKKRGIQFDKEGKIINSGSKDIKNNNDKMDHRTAINLHSSNGKTIEFRIFRSTKNLKELLKNIDFVDAICSFCRTGNASLAQMNDWIYFYEFVAKNRQDYEYLFKFLETDETFIKLLDNKQRNIQEIEEIEEEPEILIAPVAIPADGFVFGNIRTLDEMRGGIIKRQHPEPAEIIEDEVDYPKYPKPYMSGNSKKAIPVISNDYTYCEPGQVKGVDFIKGEDIFPVTNVFPAAISERPVKSPATQVKGKNWEQIGKELAKEWEQKTAREEEIEKLKKLNDDYRKISKLPENIVFHASPPTYKPAADDNW